MKITYQAVKVIITAGSNVCNAEGRIVTQNIYYVRLKFQGDMNQTPLIKSFSNLCNVSPQRGR